MYVVILTFAVAMGLSSTNASAQAAPEPWVLLHSQRISAGLHRVDLRIKNKKEYVRTRAVRLLSRDQEQELSRIEVAFGNGQVHFEDRDFELVKDRHTEPIGERDEGLVVERVSLVFGKKGSVASTVELWGLSYASAERVSSPPSDEARCKGGPITAAGKTTLLGKDRAKRLAVTRWQRDARAKYGERYMDFASAGGVKFNCDAAGVGAVGKLTKRCVVSATPCRVVAAADDDTIGKSDDDQKAFRIQRLLSRAGYLDKEAADGKVGQETNTAVRQFQRDEGLPVTGEVDDHTFERLRKRAVPGDAPKQSDDRTAPAAPKVKPYSERQVFFGTTRRREANRSKAGRTIATFSGKQGKQMVLGSAVVTIPTARDPGTIPRPGNPILSILRFRSPFEDPSRDFTVAAVDVLSESDFILKLRRYVDKSKRFQAQAFVFVHGYHVNFDDALFRTAQIAHDIEFDGPAVAFSWPSQGGLFGYRHDIDTARASRSELLGLIKLVARDTGVKSINLVAHSMGNDPVLEALGYQHDIVVASGSVADLKLNEIILAAPDVSRDLFMKLAPKLKALATGGVTLYASANDRALLASRELAGGIVRAGDVPSEGPLIVPGVQTIDVSEANSSFFSSNHSTFAARQHIIIDMKLLFTSGKRPPDERFRVFTREGREPNIYWRYMKN